MNSGRVGFGIRVMATTNHNPPSHHFTSSSSCPLPTLLSVIQAAVSLAAHRNPAYRELIQHHTFLGHVVVVHHSKHCHRGTLVDCRNPIFGKPACLCHPGPITNIPCQDTVSIDTRTTAHSIDSVNAAIATALDVPRSALRSTGWTPNLPRARLGGGPTHFQHYPPCH